MINEYDGDKTKICWFRKSVRKLKVFRFQFERLIKIEYVYDCTVHIMSYLGSLVNNKYRYISNFS